MRTLVRSLLATALTLSGLAIVAPATPALAASACDSNSNLTSSSSTATGGSSVTLTATEEDCNGGAVEGATITFSQTGGPCNATFSSATAITNANGKASVTVKLPANCPGQYQFQVSGAGITLRTTVVESGGFMATAADAPSQGRGFPSGLVLVGGGLLLMFAGLGALTLRRRQS